MNYLLLKLINMSITASYLLLAVMAIRLLFRNMPKYISCVLWGIGSIRLILPFSIESRLSLIPGAAPVTPSLIEGPTYSFDTGIEKFDLNVNHYIADKYFEGVTLPAGHGETVSNILAAIWLSVVFIMLLYCITSYARLRRKVRIRMPYKDNIFLCDDISTPFILGIIKPQIYIPSYLSEEETKLVLLHERAHIDRLDHIWKPLGFLILALHWFNPIVWLSYILFCKDIESACDQKALKNANKKDYSDLLLNLSAPKFIHACPLAFGETNVKNRIKDILKYKNPTKWVIIIGVTTCFIVSVCFLTNPVSKTISSLLNIQAEETVLEYEGSVHPIENTEALNTFLKELGNTKISFSPTSLSRSEDRDCTWSVKLKNTAININKNCDSVWIDDGVKPSYSYDIRDNDKLSYLLRKALTESVNGPTVSYFAKTKDPIGAQFWLHSNTKTFQFVYSGFSSEMPIGHYEYDGRRLFLYDETKKDTVYVFTKEGQNFVFDQEASSHLPEFKFKENEAPQSPIPHKTVFYQTKP